MHTLLSRWHYDESALLEIIQLIVEKGCNFDSTNHQGTTPLHLAARFGFLSIVRYLLDKGAICRKNTINIVLNNRKEVDPSIIPVLLRYGADANSVSDLGNNPLHTLPGVNRWE